MSRSEPIEETSGTAGSISEAVLESAPDAIVIVDTGGNIRAVNEQAERLFGYPRSELIDQPLELLVPERLRQTHEIHRRSYSRRPRIRPMGARLELAARRKDGTEFPVEISLSPVRSEEGLLITSAIRDVTDRTQREDARRRAGAIEAQEHERLRIARELHDQLSQALTGITLGLGRIEAAERLEAAQEEAESLRGEVRQALKDLRQVALQLRPDSLDELSLDGACERLVQDQQRTDPQTEIAFRGTPPTHQLEPEAELAVYRIVQEALANAARHADAELIEVELGEEGSNFCARVRDDGRGFGAEESAAGLGLGGMRERADLADGELAIHSTPGRGTEVTLRVPSRPG